MPGFSVAVLQPQVPSHVNPDGASRSASVICTHALVCLEGSSAGARLCREAPRVVPFETNRS